MKSKNKFIKTLLILLTINIIVSCGGVSLATVIKTKKEVLIKKLEEKKYDKEWKNASNWRNGYSFLMWSIENKHEKITKLLIEAGVDVNVKTSLGHTALMIASKMGETQAVNLLIKANANLDIQDDDDNTALHYAEEPSIIKALAKAGANVNIRGEWGKRPIDITQDILAKLYLVEAGADTSECNFYGKGRVLMYVTEENNTEEALAYIKLGANVNYVKREHSAGEGKKDYSALYYAIGNNNTVIVKALIKAGIDVNLEYKGRWDWHRRTHPLSYALLEDANYDIIEALVIAGADVNKEYYNLESFKPYWKSPLAEACLKKNREVQKLLIKFGADVKFAKSAIEEKYKKDSALGFLKQLNSISKAVGKKIADTETFKAVAKVYVSNNSSSSTSSKLSNTVPIYYTSRNGNDITYHIKYKDHYTSFIYFKNGDYYDMGLLSGSEKTFSKALKRALKEVIYFDDISKVRELDKYEYMDN